MSAGGLVESVARRAEVAEGAVSVAVLCAGAVDELEIVAGLEAAGFGDEEAREQGYDDVFRLAGALYRATERRPVESGAEPVRWPAGSPWRQVLRGLLFGLPGVCYVTAAPMLQRPAAAYVLIVSLLQAWPAGQVVAYLGYTRADLGDRRAALRCGALVAAAFIVPLTVLSGVLLRAGPGPTLLAVGQSLYLLGATVALVRAAEVRLLAALLPGVTAGAAGSGWWTWPAWALSLAAVLVLAAVVTHPDQEPTGHMRSAWRVHICRRGGVSWAEVRRGMPFGLFGLGAAALLMLEPVLALLGRAPVSGEGVRAAGTAGGVAVLALSLSMGPAEWVLVSYRDRVRRALPRARGLRGFRWRARLALLGAVGGYCFLLAGLMAGLAWAALLTGGRPVFLAYPVLIGHLLLGGALFAGLVLQSFGQTVAGPAGLAVALTAEVAAFGLRLGDPAVIRCFTAGALFAVLLAHSLVVLSRATAHR